MLRLLPSKAQGRKNFWKPSEPCHAGIHWRALTEYEYPWARVSAIFSFFASFVW